MNDESNGRWTVEDRGNNGWTVERNGSIVGAIYGECRALELRGLIEAAESTEPRNQPEPLPLMTGTEVMEAWDRGAAVERLTEGGWERWPGRDAYDAVRRIGFCTFVARVVEPPAPATERVPLAFVRGRRLPGCDWVIAQVNQDPYSGAWAAVESAPGSIPQGRLCKVVTPDDDGTVEVLTEGTDKP